MATAESTKVNGVDVSALEGAIESITDDPAGGAFTFRAETEWEDALKSVTTIDEFDHAGRPSTPASSRSRATNPNRSWANERALTRSNSAAGARSDRV